MKWHATALAAVVLTGCATAPAPSAFSPEMSFPISKDEAWPKVVRLFAEQNLPIKTIEKASGLIASDSLPVGVRSEFLYCRPNPLLPPIESFMTFNVLVEPEGEGSRVRVSVVGRQVRATPGGRDTVECESTGLLERTIFARLERLG